MDNIDFTEDEIQEQLELLGYKNIPKHRLSEFKKGLFHFCLCVVLSLHCILLILQHGFYDFVLKKVSDCWLLPI